MENKDNRKRTRTTITPAQLLELGKLPPQATDLEEVVLGAMMLDKECLSNVFNILTNPEVFYKDAHKHIFIAIKSLYEKAEPVDILTVTQELKKAGELEIAGGAYYITQLTNRVASGANSEKHAHIILEKFLQRELIRISTSLLQTSYEDTSDVFELLAKAEQELFTVSNSFIKKKSEIVRVVAGKAIAEIEAMQTNGTSGISSGWARLDALAGGWGKGDLIILAARPGMGKSTAAMQFARHAAVVQERAVAVFSLEMTSTQLVMRLFSSEAEIPAEKIFQGKLEANEFETLNKHIGRLVASQLFLDDTPALSLFEFRSKARRLKAQNDISLIVVDYLQLMTADDGFGRSREQEVSLISRTLKAIAKELDIPIIALSQMSRAVEQRTDKKGRPQLSDLRESGCLHGDTLIQCPEIKKTFKISELADKNNFNVFSTDYKNVLNTKAKKCFSTGKKKVFEIELLNGQKIKATNNHKFLTENGWVELKNIKKNKIAIPINYSDNTDDLKNKNEISLIGHFLSNGTAIKRQPIHYTCNVLDDDLTKIVIRDAIDATGKKVKPYYKDHIEDGKTFRTIFFKPTFHLTHGKTSPVADIMRKYGLWDLRAKEKFIPDELFYLSHDNTHVLLKSLFSGDGCAYYAEKKGRKSLKISYSSSSEKLISGIQQLLAKVGILSFITKLSNKKKQSWFNLCIYGKSNIGLFVKNIGFWNKRKNNVMINGWEKSKNNLAGWNKYNFNYERLLCYMPIKKIKSIGVHDVYDIEVDKLHNFVANNIIVHNSIEQDADMVMFIYQPAKMGYDTDEDGNSTEGVAEIIIAKHRNGRVGSESFFFNDKYVKFEDNINSFSVINNDPFNLQPQIATVNKPIPSDLLPPLSVDFPEEDDDGSGTNL